MSSALLQSTDALGCNIHIFIDFDYFYNRQCLKVFAIACCIIHLLDQRLSHYMAPERNRRISHNAFGMGLIYAYFDSVTTHFFFYYSYHFFPTKSSLICIFNISDTTIYSLPCVLYIRY